MKRENGKITARNAIIIVTSSVKAPVQYTAVTSNAKLRKEKRVKLNYPSATV